MAGRMLARVQVGMGVGISDANEKTEGTSGA